MTRSRTDLLAVISLCLSLMFLLLLGACDQAAAEEGACFGLSHAYNTEAGIEYCQEAPRGEWIDGQCYCHGEE